MAGAKGKCQRGAKCKFSQIPSRRCPSLATRFTSHTLPSLIPRPGKAEKLSMNTRSRTKPEWTSPTHETFSPPHPSSSSVPHYHVLHTHIQPHCISYSYTHINTHIHHSKVPQDDTNIRALLLFIPQLNPLTHEVSRSERRNEAAIDKTV